jgi:hypothetical protein
MAILNAIADLWGGEGCTREWVEMHNEWHFTNGPEEAFHYVVTLPGSVAHLREDDGRPFTTKPLNAYVVNCLNDAPDSWFIVTPEGHYDRHKAMGFEVIEESRRRSAEKFRQLNARRLAGATLHYWANGDLKSWVEEFDLAPEHGPDSFYKFEDGSDAQEWLTMNDDRNHNRVEEYAMELIDIVQTHIAEAEADLEEGDM